MLLFSTLLKINNTMTPDSFIELLIEWNQNTPHKENRIPNIRWNKQHNIRFGNDEVWMEIKEYPKENIIAVRYEQNDSNGITWDSDFVMNFETMKLAIRLDRTYSEDALSLEQKFSSPYFIELLIEQNYLLMDNKFPILYKPFSVTPDNVDLLIDILSRDINHYELPIVYVTKTLFNKDPIDVDKLAERLRGIAHVLVQSTNKLNKNISFANTTISKSYGNISIFFPKHPQDVISYQNGKLDEIVHKIIDYHNTQSVDALYTWHGVNTALLQEQILQYKQQLKNSKQMDVPKEEWEEVFQEFESQIQELNATTRKLTCENDSLKNALTRQSSTSQTVLYGGEEEEFYEGEIADYILSELNKSLHNTPSDSRRYHILKDVLTRNNYQHLNESKATEAKRILKGYTHFTSKMLSQLQDLGFTITSEKNHYKLEYYGKNKYQFTCAKTPSDNRAGENNAAKINKLFF